mgnify:CR=1 FL=1
MFNIFGKKKVEETPDSTELDYGYLPKGYDDAKVKVFYEGEVLSPEYVERSLVFNEGGDIRKNFNDQGYPYHNLFPHGKGKIVYKHGDEIIEEYKGEFDGGQYHGKGTLVDMHGEILEGNFANNKFVG